MTRNGVLLIAAGAAAYLLLRDGGADPDTGESDAAPDVSDWVNQATDAAATIFDSSAEDMSNPNIAAFLGAIRVGEGTSDGDGYRRLCGGGNFDSFGTHPALAGWRGFPLSAAQCAGAGFGPGCVSTAAGAFQINRPTWNRVAGVLGLSDFSPASQDAAAIQLIREKGALGDVMAGRVADAVAKVRKVWASLPGAGYGQREVGLGSFQDNFLMYGGVMA